MFQMSIVCELPSTCSNHNQDSRCISWSSPTPFSLSSVSQSREGQESYPCLHTLAKEESIRYGNIGILESYLPSGADVVVVVVVVVGGGVVVVGGVTVGHSLPQYSQ